MFVLSAEHSGQNIRHGFWQNKHNEYTEELMRLESLFNQHSRANLSYIENGSKLLELAKRAYWLFLSQSPSEQRKLVDLVLHNIRLPNHLPQPRTDFGLAFELDDKRIPLRVPREVEQNLPDCFGLGGDINGGFELFHNF